jgi:hypothetical protein
MRTLTLTAGLMAIAGTVHASTISLDTLDAKRERGTAKVKVGTRELSFTADDTGRISVNKQKIKDSRNQELGELSFTVVMDSDPYIGYGWSFTNSTASPLAFSMTFTEDYIDGPWDTLDSSHSSSVTDSGKTPDDSVVVTPRAGGFIHTPHIDGVTIAAARIGTGCSVNPPGPGGGSDMCHPSSFLSVPVGPTPISGKFDVVLAVTLSAYDVYTGNGRVELRSSVPDEVSTAFLLLVAVGVMFVTRNRLSRAA